MNLLKELESKHFNITDEFIKVFSELPAREKVTALLKLATLAEIAGEMQDDEPDDIADFLARVKKHGVD